MKKTFICSALAVSSLGSYLSANLQIEMSPSDSNSNEFSIRVYGSGVFDGFHLFEHTGRNFSEFGSLSFYDNDFLFAATASAGVLAIGDYVDASYSGAPGEYLLTGLTVTNEDTLETALARWVLIGDQNANDDIFLVLENTRGNFLVNGDRWSIDGITAVVLQEGDRDDFNLGLYTGDTVGIGPTVLRIIPEPSAFALVLSLSALAHTVFLRRNRKQSELL